MLISKEELENLKRYEEAQARLSSRSLRTVLEEAFADRESRQNPKDVEEDLPPELHLTYEDFESAAQSLCIDSSLNNTDTILNASYAGRIRWREFYEALIELYPEEFVESTLLPQFKKPFAEFRLAAAFALSRGHYRLEDIEIPDQLKRLLSAIERRDRIFLAAIKELRTGKTLKNQLRTQPMRAGALYILGRLCAAPLEASGYLDLPNARGGLFGEILYVTSDFWATFQSYKDISDYLLDPSKEKERLITDQTISITGSYFAEGEDFIKWCVAAGYTSIKRLVPIVGSYYAENHGGVGRSYAVDHAGAKQLLMTLALLKMPAKQLKGYSKKLRNFIEEAMTDAGYDLVSLGHDEPHRFIEEYLAGALSQNIGSFPFTLRELLYNLLDKLANSVSGDAGEYLSFAAELRQKNGGSLRFDSDLLKLLGADDLVATTARSFSASGELSFEYEVALAAAILSAYPQRLYDEIPKLSTRTFDFLQSKILEYYRAKPNLKGESLIELYLRPSERVSELSYLDWCSNLMEAFAESDGGNWEGFDSDAEEDAEILAKNARREDKEELALFLEGDEPELITRDFNFSVLLRGGGLARGFDLSEMGMSNTNTGLEHQFLLADIYRRANLKLGGNVDKSLHPKWYEIDGEDGLYFVELPRFHPIWWIIGSTSIANCCMTPNNVGRTSCRSGFWGNRDRSFILVHEPTSTIIGSLQGIGGKLGKNTKGWELVFDGVEFRNTQRNDSEDQAAILKSVKENFEDNENIKTWLRRMMPYLPEGGGGYSLYIDYAARADWWDKVPDGYTKNIPEGFVSISDQDSAYRDFAQKGASCVAMMPVSFAGKDFSGVYVAESEFTRLDLSRCNFEDAEFESVTFSGCDLTDVNFKDASFDDVAFTMGASIRGANFDGSFFRGSVDFTQAYFVQEASFERVVNLDSMAEFP